MDTELSHPAIRVVSKLEKLGGRSYIKAEKESPFLGVWIYLTHASYDDDTEELKKEKLKPQMGPKARLCKSLPQIYYEPQLPNLEGKLKF